MPYLFVVAAVLCGTLKGFFGKKSSGALKDLREMLLFNLVRTLFCVAIGCVWLGLSQGFGLPDRATWEIAALAGVSMGVFLLTWMLAVRSTSYVTIDICCSAGMVLPCLLGGTLFGEYATPWQYLGIVGLLLAVVLLSQRGETKTANKPMDLLVPFFVFLSSGVNNLSYKLFAHSAGASDTLLYNTLTFAFTALFLAICLPFLPKHGQGRFSIKPHLIALTVMAGALFLNSFFLTRAASGLPSAVLFPLNTGLTLMLSFGMATVCFREKVTARRILGVIVAFAALLLVNG